jgi:Methyltransferase domain
LQGSTPVPRFAAAKPAAEVDGLPGLACSDSLDEATYDRIGAGYGAVRRTDPGIAARINDALGNARTIVNVGAGADSYEPADRSVTAVEPSAEMIAQRPAGSAPVVQTSAEDLPFDDDSFDAAIAVGSPDRGAHP